ncbi:signal recognition particle-docking protein FtsY [Clostridiales bacterium oral taxon 876 str. F0540]|nr:signal recognition particle-docking protein FtsY [Clostridiales bacterium oral taxon 876 str. F0540]
MFNAFFEKLKNGLAKTKDGFTDKIGQMLNLYVTIDDELYEELEEILITSDIGVETALEIIERVKIKVKENRIKQPSEVNNCLKQVLIEMMDADEENDLISETPSILLIVGVNGVGKTTSIGKIAAKLKNDNKKVLLAAADTFRAAAIDQLEVWSNRASVDIVRHQEGSDPAAVVFDAIQAAKSRKVDVLICDTAGRLHNKKNLMDELGKINRIIEREFSEANKQTLLVLDATTGQNAVQQAKQFMDVCKVDGIILTKLDGTAKGGVVISIKHQLNIPVKLIGVGEGIDDLQEFKARDFVEALFE